MSLHMVPARFRHLPVLLAILLASCGDARSRAVQTISRVGDYQLRREAAIYYKNIYAEHRHSPATIQPDYWSWGFAQFEPIRITVYPDGLAFCLERRGDAESGLYIVPLGMEHAPAPTAWASYERLSDGFYWYSFKP